MREIAEQLGISKPAIYYHFASKEEILMALHMRLHEFGRAALARLAGQPVTLEVWGSLLDEVLDQMLAQRKIFLLHERNQAALEKLHRKDHDDEHEDIQQRFRQALADPSLSLRDRVRMACSLGAVLGGLLMAGDAFDNVSSAELGSLVRDAVRDVVGDPRPDSGPITGAGISRRRGHHAPARATSLSPCLLAQVPGLKPGPHIAGSCARPCGP